MSQILLSGLSDIEKLAISIRAPFFERSVFYLHVFVCAAFPIREPFWEARNLYSRSILRCILFFLGLPNGTYQL